MAKLKDKKIVIYKKVITKKDADGFSKTQYSPIHAGKLWAYARQLSGKELYMAMTLTSEEEMLFTVNWRDDLTMDRSGQLYVSYKGIWYDVKRIDTYEGNKSDISIYAKSSRRPEQENIMEYKGGD